MGDYNADTGYSRIESVDLIHWKNFFNGMNVKWDQWTIDSAHRVQSFHTGDNIVDCAILYDPHFML